MDYPIGTRFTTRGKAGRQCVVVDVYRTYNAAGELVKVRYAAEHVFVGQKVIDHDVLPTTIARGLSV